MVYINTTYTVCTVKLVSVAAKSHQTKRTVETNLD